MKKFILSTLLIVVAGFIFASTTRAQANTDCQNTFDKELYKCLQESGACINSCVDKARSVMSLEVDGGKVNLECQRSTCGPAKKACDEQVKASFKACLDARKTKEEAIPETKKETSAQTAGRFEWPDPRDLIYDYLLKEAARFNINAPGYWEIKPEDFVISRGAPKPEGGNIWIVEPRTKVWVKGVGLVQLRPGSGTSGMFAVEEINGEISPLLLMGEMEVRYGKPVEEATQKPIDWEQIKLKVRTPNSSVTVSRTHYLVRFDEKKNETTVQF